MVRQIMRRLGAESSGQGLPEYALLIALIVGMVVAAVYFLYPEVVLAIFEDTGSYILDSPQAQGVR